MQVEIIKQSGIYSPGIAYVTDAMGKYLIRIGAAKVVEEKKPVKKSKNVK